MILTGSKQAKLSHLGHRKPASIHWKADAPKTSHCLVRILVQRHTWAIFFFENEQGDTAIVIGPCWMNFCSQKFKKRILVTFDFNRTALCATQPKLYSMFCALFLKIASSAAKLMSFGRLGAAIWHRWLIICRVPSKISVLKIALSAAELMSFGHFGAVIWQRCTIICEVPSKIGVTPTSQK